MRFVFNPFTNAIDFVGNSGEAGSIAIADVEGLEDILDGKLNTGNPTAIPDVPAAPTNEQLRTSIQQILTALRNTGIAIPQITYTATAGGSYTYNSASHTVTAIRDGILNAGMMVTNSATVLVQATFAEPRLLKAVHVYSGQFNGAFNMPQSLQIFAGAVTNTLGTPLYSGSLAPTAALQAIDLSTDPDFDIPRSSLTFAFGNSTGGVNVSVNELQLFGTA